MRTCNSIIKKIKKMKIDKSYDFAGTECRIINVNKYLQ